MRRSGSSPREAQNSWRWSVRPRSVQERVPHEVDVRAVFTEDGHLERQDHGQAVGQRGEGAARLRCHAHTCGAM
jgi:hypothetical protein